MGPSFERNIVWEWWKTIDRLGYNPDIVKWLSSTNFRRDS